MSGEGRTSRGLITYTEVEDDYGGTVTVDESSAAESPHVWLRLQECRADCATAHLGVDAARRLRDGLSAFLDAAGADQAATEDARQFAAEDAMGRAAMGDGW